MDQEILETLSDSFRRFYREQQPLEQRVAMYQQGHVTAPDSWETAAGLGWLSLSLPDDLGGFAASPGECLQLIRLAGGDARPELFDQHWLLSPLFLGALTGTERQSMGEALANGTRQLRLTTGGATLTTTEGLLYGDAGVFMGQEQEVSDLLIPVASNQGLRLCVVQPGDAGVHLKPGRLLDGRRCCSLTLNGATVRWLDAESGKGQAALDLVAGSMFADAVGVLEAAFELTLDYLKQRIQFGQPLSRQQAVQQVMADVFCDLQQAITLHRRLCAEWQQPAQTPALLPAVKSFIGRRLLRAAGRLIQVSGGIAMTEEYKLGHYYRRLQVAATLFGDADEQLHRMDPFALLRAPC